MNFVRPPILAGLISPEVLKEAETGEASILGFIKDCNALEIRYDLFSETEWKGLAFRVKKIHPQAVLLATIRLKRDGGAFDNAKAYFRLPLWENLLEESDCADWFDIEQECLSEVRLLRPKMISRKVKLLLSKHDFSKIPTPSDLSNFLKDCKSIKAQGLKIVGMSLKEGDYENLYSFAQKNALNFEWFAAFAMGQTGQISRKHSLHFGANLTYGVIQGALAPGQLHVRKMREYLNSPPFDNLSPPTESEIS